VKNIFVGILDSAPESIRCLFEPRTTVRKLN
jgi:hypothetical protein